MNVGYARISARDQHIEAQLERLAHCERVFREQGSGKGPRRPVLDACLEFVRDGDTLTVTRLDRLARSVAHLCAIAACLHSKHVSLVVLDQAIDTSTPTGVLLFHVLAAIAEFELGLRKEQQHAGITYARAQGKRSGRLPALSGAAQEELALLIEQGQSVSEIARRLHVSVRTVYRYQAASLSALAAPPLSAP